MNSCTCKWRIRLVIAYAIPFIASVIFLFATASKSAFCGIYAIMLTLPWSLLLFKLWNTLSSNHPFESMIPGCILIFLSAAINMGLLYLVGWLIDTLSKNHDKSHAQKSHASRFTRK